MRCSASRRGVAEWVAVLRVHMHMSPRYVPPLPPRALLLVQDVTCECGTNGGIVYNQGGAVRDVLFQRLRVTSTNQACRGEMTGPTLLRLDDCVPSCAYACACRVPASRSPGPATMRRTASCQT